MATSKSKSGVECDEYLKPDTQHMIPGPRWRDPTAKSDLDRVLDKEAAAESAVHFLNKILSILMVNLDQNPSAQSRIDKINGIISRKKKFQVFIGLRGTTGAGKSTLINALINLATLLPSSIERACTAVPVEVSHNASNDPNSKYIAEVIYITAQEWRAELQRAFDAINSDDDEEDTESESLIRQAFDKVKCIYPSISSLEKMKETSVQQLLSVEFVQKILGSTKVIKMSKKSEFSDSVRSHIDSGDSSHNSAYWPLVKLVRIKVKAPILAHGITLVDLPGGADSNTARSAIAEQYQSKLSVTCILADARRGVSEATAHDLLEKVTKRNLQLDGLYNSGSLCFILSQTDRSFNVKEYLDSHPKVKELCVGDEKLYRELDAKLGTLRKEKKVAEKSMQESIKLAKKTKSQIKSLKVRLKAQPNNTDGPLVNRKRRAGELSSFSRPAQANAEQLELRHELTNLERILTDSETNTDEQMKSSVCFDRRITHLEKAALHASSRLHRACIVSRNEYAKAVMREEYQKTLAQMGQESKTPLQVFCVASTLHLQYKSSPFRAKGFLNFEDTQIPALRDWLVATTFESRESCAQNFLEEVETFLDSNSSWITDKYGEQKMPAEIRESWEVQMLEEYTKLEKNFASLSVRSSEAFSKLVHKNLYEDALPSAVRTAEKIAKNRAEMFSKGVNWSTHRATNRNHGDWVDSRKREYTWNDDLADDLIKPLLRTWNETFQEQFPAEQQTYIQMAKDLISDFASVISGNSLYPDVADTLEEYTQFFLRNQSTLDAHTKMEFQEVTAAYRMSHRRIIPAIREFLSEMYTTCGQEGGQGHYLRNRNTHKHWFDTKAHELHLLASQAMKVDLDKMLSAIPRILERGYQASLKDIKEKIAQFFHENTAPSLSICGPKVESPAKIKLSRELMTQVIDLSEAWTTGGQFKEVIDEGSDEDDVMLLGGADLFDIGETDVGDSEGDSDQDGSDDDGRNQDGNDQDEAIMVDGVSPSSPPSSPHMHF